MNLEKLPYRPCVGLMIVNQHGRVFVGQRIDNREGKAWQMPQGGVDKGEETLHAAWRELYEETGIGRDLVELVAETASPLLYDLPPELVPNFWKGRFRGQSQHWLLVRFTGTDADINLEAHDPAEFCDFRWVQPDELPDLAVEFKRGVYTALVEQFGPLIAA